MNAEQWARVKTLFHAALDQPPERRPEFLVEACDDDGVRREVERLLTAHLKSEAFIEESPINGALSTALQGPLSGRVIGHYSIGAMLGSGGMGTVYAARDLELERTVAIKVVPGGPASVQLQLRREAQRASKLNHPNVCVIHDVGDTGGMTYVVMEHIEGQTLSALLSRAALPAERVVRYGVHIADALAHAHERGLVHHDLKCANIMVTPDGRAKVLDFGLARDTPGDRIGALSQSNAGLSEEEPLAGTLAYMAPERFRGEPGGVQSDLWALGVVLFEMATGERPFQGRTGFELSASILHQPAPGLPAAVPTSVQSVIWRCLAKDPRERYTTAGQVRTELETALSDPAAAGIPYNRLQSPSAREPVQRRLPEERTSFIGRSRERARLAHDVKSNRIVTLTGVGGCGKTRLALKVAEALGDAFADGVWWVDLTPFADATRVDEAVAATLGVLGPQRTPRDAVLEFVRGRKLLLVLDNCEHLLSSAAALVDWLVASCESVHVLTTSREGLGIAGERILAVPSLSIPERESSASLQEIEASDAVRLFVERARATVPDFSLTSRTAPGIVDVCRRLDGIPLAIELAAASVRVLSIDQIRDRLDHRLSSLSGRGRSMSRHQTLSATLRWSYDLLGAEEQRALRRLSVFRGGWTLSAAASVCGDNIGGVEILELLWRLVEKSLVEVAHTAGAEARYRLLEMVRQFAFDLLVDAGEAPETQQRYATHYLEFFEQAIPHLLGPREASTVRMLESELDNVVAAFAESCRFQRGAERVMRAVADSWLLWVSRGHLALARELLTTALQGFPLAEPAARARGLMASCMFARFSGDRALAMSDCQASVALYEQLEIPDPAGLAFALFHRAAALMTFTADRVLAGQDLERGVVLSQQAGDRMVLGICRNLLAMVAIDAGDLQGAESCYREALSTARESGSPYLLILYIGNLAVLYANQGRWNECEEFVREVITLLQDSGNRHFAPGCVLLTATLLASSGELKNAWRLTGAAVSMWLQIGELPDDGDLRSTERILESLGARAEDPEYAKARAEGEALAFDRALAEALDALRRRGAGVTE